MSYGLGELYEAISQLQTDSQYFATLAAEGVTIFVSTGDGGSTPGLNGAGDNSGPLQVQSPACDPSVTAVGGTILYLNTSTGTRVSETVWYLSGGGQSASSLAKTVLWMESEQSGRPRLPHQSGKPDSNVRKGSWRQRRYPGRNVHHGIGTTRRFRAPIDIGFPSG
jgi:hypothetical protein